MVKVRNFDDTIITVPPQMLADGSFQNWIGMKEGPGRKQTRQVYFDFRSVALLDNATKQQLVADGFATKEDAEAQAANVTLFRLHIERWLASQSNVVGEKPILVRQADATQAGMCLEFMFWLKEKGGPEYEHATSLIMEYIYAAAPKFGLSIYQHSNVITG